MTHVTHVNGWSPAVYMSYMSQNFRLFLVSDLSVLNFQIFLLMYPGCGGRRLSIPVCLQLAASSSSGSRRCDLAAGGDGPRPCRLQQGSDPCPCLSHRRPSAAAALQARRSAPSPGAPHGGVSASSTRLTVPHRAAVRVQSKKLYVMPGGWRKQLQNRARRRRNTTRRDLFPRPRSVVIGAACRGRRAGLFRRTRRG